MFKCAHDVSTNLRLLSVQAGIAGGGMTAALGAYQAAANAAHINAGVPGWLFAISGILTAVGVFAARMWPQPNVNTEPK